MKIQKKTTKTVDTTCTINLDGSDIIHLLACSGMAVPRNASVEFSVPGGGDWSNTDIVIDESNPIVVSYRDVEEETEE